MRHVLFWWSSALMGLILGFTIKAAYAADLLTPMKEDAISCTSAYVVTDLHTTWDFMENPEGTVSGVEGFALSHMIRTVLVNNPNALEQVLNVPFAHNEAGAAVTGLARAACACMRNGNYTIADQMLAVRNELNGWLGRAYDQAWNQCVSPTPRKRETLGSYINVSPSKVQ